MKEEKKMLDIEILSNEEGLAIDERDNSFKKVAVIGAGTMGRGISQLVASKGLDVILIEKDQELAERALESITVTIDKEIARWTMTAGEKKSILSRIALSCELKDAVMGDVVIEAIPENLSLKQDIFKKLDAICKDETILVTNTSTLSITEIASVISNESKIIGMHFLNPVPKIPLQTYSFYASLAWPKPL